MPVPLISGKSLSGWEGGRERSFLTLPKSFGGREGGRSLFLTYPRSLVGGREGGRGLFLTYPRSFGGREGEVFSYLIQDLLWVGGREGEVFSYLIQGLLVGGREGGRGLFLPYPRSFGGWEGGRERSFLTLSKVFFRADLSFSRRMVERSISRFSVSMLPKVRDREATRSCWDKARKYDHSKHRRQSPDLFAAEIRKESDYDNIQC